MPFSNFQPDDTNIEPKPDSEPNSQPWTPAQGPVAKIFAWLILICIAIILLGMLAAVFGT